MPPRGYLGPIVSALLIVAAGLGPWTVLSSLNRAERPDLPWAAAVTTTWVALLLAWLHGWGWPRATASTRHARLRLWPPSPADGGDGLSTSAIVGLLAILYALWIAVGRLSPAPDLSVFPTTAYRWSMFLMGGLLSGVVEEAAYRGYLQTGLERHDPDRAIVVTSLVFVGSHLTQGVTAVLLLGPGLFAASVLYGLLARRTGTILPGMAIHVAGDLAYTWAGVLGGDLRLLFVSASS